MKNSQGLTVWTTAIPLFFELVAVTSINIMDVFFMSLVSDKAVAAMGATTQVIMVFTLLIRTLTGGAGSIAGQSLGANNTERANHAFMYSMVIAIVVGFVFALALYLGREQIGVWMGLNNETLVISTVYLSIIGPAFFLLSVRTGYSTIASVKGKSNLNLICALIANAVNIFFNCLLVLGWLGAPKLGVTGVAIATAISYAVYLVLIALVTHFGLKVHFSFTQETLKKVKDLTRPVLGIGIPNCGDLLSYSLFQVIIMMIVIRVGETSAAAYVYVHQAMSFVIIWSYAIAQGQSILTAHLVGSKQFNKAETEIKRSILRGASLAIPVTLALYFFAEEVFQLFTDDPEILTIISSAILAYVGIELGRAFNATLSFSLAAAGDARYPAILGLIFNWLIGVPTAFFLAHWLGWGLIGALLGIALDELLRSPLNYRRLTSRRWHPKESPQHTAS